MIYRISFWGHKTHYGPVTLYNLGTKRFISFYKTRPIRSHIGRVIDFLSVTEAFLIIVKNELVD